MQNKCLYCYDEISSAELKTEAGSEGFHQKCSRRFFGKVTPPVLGFTENEILEIAEEVIKSQKTVTGVQPKLSLGLTDKSVVPERFAIVGLRGEFILKPQTKMFPSLPENEDLTMRLAQISKIKTVEHSLIRLKSGQLAYITKRVDRDKGSKVHMEDMCQLTGRLTEHKYQGSYEQIAKSIKKFTANPGLDVIDFFELVLFCFLTGNNDMHLKNFSLIKRGVDHFLCPAYDLVASELVVEGDDEELALNLNGKKKRLKKEDFHVAMKGAGIDPKVIDNIFKKYQKLLPSWIKEISNSFLPGEMKERYKKMILKKAQQLELK